MKCIIASNRPLPIRYYVNPQCFIKRGIICPSEISLPFFVEVEAEFLGDYSIIAEYIHEVKSQYKQCHIQIYSKETSLLEWLSEKQSVKLIQSSYILIE